MNDNKKYGKRFSTIFWWCLTIAPIIYAVGVFVASIINIGFSNGSAHMTSTAFSGYFDYIGEYIGNLTTPFENLIWGDLNSTISEVFTSIFNVNNGFLNMCFTWALQVQLLHILFDVMCYVPKFAHYLLEKF